MPDNRKPLMGTDEATIDDKGRILIAKKKRERLGEPFVLAVGTVGCLTAYPQHIWDTMYAEIDRYGGINQGREHYTRLLLGTMEDDLAFDSQGRVVIPHKLRELFQLGGKVLVVGCGNRLEIWAKPEWEKYMQFPDTYGEKRREAIARAYDQMVGRP